MLGFMTLNASPFFSVFVAICSEEKLFIPAMHLVLIMRYHSDPDIYFVIFTFRFTGVSK